MKRGCSFLRFAPLVLFFSCGNGKQHNDIEINPDSTSPSEFSIDDFPEPDQPKKGHEESDCNFKRVYLLEDYAEEPVSDDLPCFVFIDFELRGDGDVDYDLVDVLAGKIQTEAGELKDTWLYDSFFLDETGRPAEENEQNCNKDYMHVGLIMPAPKDPVRIELWYWGGPLCPTDGVFEKNKSEIPK